MVKGFSRFQGLAGLVAAGAVGLLGAAGCSGESGPEGRYEEYQPGTSGEAMKPGQQVRIDLERVQTVNVKPLWVAGAKDGKRLLAGLTHPQNGRWVAPGKEPGVAAGEYLCSQIVGAHVCSGPEVVKAAAQGDFRGMPSDSTIWVSRATEIQYGGTTYEGSSNATCLSYNYETADQAWNASGGPSRDDPSGIVFTFGPARVTYDQACAVDRNACVPHVPTGMGCNAQRSIPCCY